MNEIHPEIEAAKRKIKEEEKYPKVIARLPMDRKTWKKAKRAEKQLKRRAENYLLNPEANELARDRAKERRLERNNKRLNNGSSE